VTRELERVLADACFGERSGDAIAGDLRGFLEARGVAAEDVAAIVAAPHHLAVYRSLVRNGLGGVIARILPRTRARMNAACARRFDEDVGRFLADVGPRTHYLRDVPAELLAWAGPRWRRDPAVPAYLADLAAHELAAFAVSTAENAPPLVVPGAIALDTPIAFASSLRLFRYAWAVHELPAGDVSTEEPAQRDVALLAYRDAEHAVHWLELSPLAASLVERLVAGDTLQAAIASACADHRTSPAAATTIDIARLLSDLGDRNVLLGAR
jgi:hypothetical protein